VRLSSALEEEIMAQLEEEGEGEREVVVEVAEAMARGVLEVMVEVVEPDGMEGDAADAFSVEELANSVEVMVEVLLEVLVEVPEKVVEVRVVEMRVVELEELVDVEEDSLVKNWSMADCAVDDIVLLCA